MPVIMNEAIFRPEEVSLVRSLLAPGETLLELCPFLHGPLAIAALTNRNLHCVRFNRTRHKGPRLVEHSMINIATISSVAISQRTKENVRLSFWTDGRQEILDSYNVKEMMEFAEQLKRLVTSTAGVAAQGTLSIADEIAKLSGLTDEGILTQDELTRAKELFLGQPKSNIDQSIQLLRNLKDLQKNGVLSESEFNMKKWDVLSKRDFQ